MAKKFKTDFNYKVSHVDIDTGTMVIEWTNADGDQVIYNHEIPFDDVTGDPMTGDDLREAISKLFPHEFFQNKWKAKSVTDKDKFNHLKNFTGSSNYDEEVDGFLEDNPTLRIV
jgi:hypothetical protein